MVKNPLANAGDARAAVSIPGSGAPSPNTKWNFVFGQKNAIWSTALLAEPCWQGSYQPTYMVFLLHDPLTHS